MPRKYCTLISAVHLFLMDGNKILLLRRFNTGYEDGNYSVPAGHAESGEKITQAMQRESLEEIDINLSDEQLKMVHVMHRFSLGQERIDFFFKAELADLQPKNAEPEKCDELLWADAEKVPENTIPYVKKALELIMKGKTFSEFGWED